MNLWGFMTAWWLGHPSEKYEFVNWDDDIPNIHGKIKWCSKPPTRWGFFCLDLDWIWLDSHWHLLPELKGLTFHSSNPPTRESHRSPSWNRTVCASPGPTRARRLLGSWWNSPLPDDSWIFMIINIRVSWSMMINDDQWWSMMINDDQWWSIPLCITAYHHSA